MKQLLESCKECVFSIHEKFDASHDFAHIERVLRNSEKIMSTEPTANQEVIRLAVLLHDIEDAKYFSEENPTISDILTSLSVKKDLIAEILHCIQSVSFSGGNEKEITSLEGAIIRDADRLDAMGAIGIARTFAFGGAKGRKLYDFDEVVRMKMSEEDYRERGTASVTHFHEKLLLLKNLMITKEGKRLAEERHAFMVLYLEQLEREVNE